MTQPPLFHELEFTKENVLAWAYEQVNTNPDSVLRAVLLDHYVREWTDLDRGELIDELRTYITGGVDKPLDMATADELLAEVMEVCEEAYEFQTMDDFVRCFAL